MDKDQNSQGLPLWHGRFNVSSAEVLRNLNSSIGFDLRLYREDIAASKAHAKMLETIGIYDEVELSEVLKGLEEVMAEIESGSIVILPDDEDVHTLVERRLTEITPAGAKLHTGRSRNDQVVTDLRLWTKRICSEIVSDLISLQETLVAKAKSVEGLMMPAYTHLQQAQPVPVAHHLLAHGWAISRDIQRLIESRNRTDVSPLGAGALAGSSLPLDSHSVADELKFSTLFANSLDAVSDRDFVVDVLSAISLLGVHLSRLGEEVILWSSTEFNFIELDDAYATGSSMMPQKKNPDIAELARAKSGRLIGNLTSLLVSLKGIPLAYNKDLQEDKEALFDSVDTILSLLPAVDGMLETMIFNAERLNDLATSPYMVTTDIAEWLVLKGIPFRQAHALVAGLVQEALSTGESLKELVVGHELLGAEAAKFFDSDVIANIKSTHGSGSIKQLEDQLSLFEENIAMNKKIYELQTPNKN